MTSFSFPLYDTFYGMITEEPLSEESKEEFMTEIGNLSVNHAELVYMLIKTYAQRTHETNFLPYGGKILKKGVRFDFNMCPHPLQQILYLFVKQNMK